MTNPHGTHLFETGTPARKKSRIPLTSFWREKFPSSKRQQNTSILSPGFPWNLFSPSVVHLNLVVPVYLFIKTDFKGFRKPVRGMQDQIILKNNVKVLKVIYFDPEAKCHRLQM